MRLAKKAVLGLFLLVLIILLASLALGYELRIYGIDKLPLGKPSSIAMALYSDRPFFGIIKLNLTNCNVSQAAFAFSSFEFQQNGSFFVYHKIIPLISNSLGSYSVVFSALNLSSQLLVASRFDGSVAIVDTTPPVITLISPQALVETQFVNVTFTTDEFAVCRLDETNVSFNSMARRLSDQDTLHAIRLDLASGRYRYYASCEDRFGNIMTPIAIDFQLAAEPTAQITLNPSSPVKAGLLEITLATSMPLGNVPQLSYDFNSGVVKPIALEGLKETWKGYLVIEADNSQKIGAFHYSGVSSTGEHSSTITSGELFIVDTVPPGKVTSLVADSGPIISLSWYFNDEDVDHFNIYRSLSPDVTQVNLFGKSSAYTFADVDTVGGVTYYYSVAAVDKAGNEGPLSDVVSALSTRQIVQTQQPSSGKVSLLASSLVFRVNNTLKQLGDLGLDMQSAKDEFSSLTDTSLKFADSTLKLSVALKDSEQRLESMRKQLKELWYQDRTEREVDTNINQVLDMAAALRHSTPKGIRLIQSTSFSQSFNNNLFQDSVSVFLKGYALGSDAVAKYSKSTASSQDYLHVAADIDIVEVTYIDDTTADYTIWDKKISIDGDNTASNLVEAIPKSVAEDVKDITFLTTGFEVLRSDPVVSWPIQGNSEIKYYVKGSVGIDAAKTTFTSILAPFNDESSAARQNSSASPIPTASVVNPPNSIFSPTEEVMIFLGLIIVVGLLVYYFASTSFDDVVAERDLRRYVKKARKTKSSFVINQYSDFLAMQEDHEYLYAHMLLRKAHVYIESKETERALSIYRELQAIYPKLSKEHQVELYDGCLKLYERLGVDK